MLNLTMVTRKQLSLPVQGPSSSKHSWVMVPMTGSTTVLFSLPQTIGSQDITQSWAVPGYCLLVLCGEDHSLSKWQPPHICSKLKELMREQLENMMKALETQGIRSLSFTL